MPKAEKQIALLDAGAVLNNPDFSFSGGKKYLMPSSVFSELKDMRARLLADNALKNSVLSLKEPEEKSIKEAKESAKKLNTKLSKADFDVLALAIRMRENKEDFFVITDDYSLQNVLSSLKIKFEPAMHSGIKGHFVLKRKCRNCGKILEGTSCDFCGNDNQGQV